MYLNTKSICRTCMHTNNLFNINETTLVDLDTRYTNINNGSGLTLLDLLKSGVPQLNVKNDNFPQFVCLKCMERLKNICVFQLDCLKVERELYQMFGEPDVVNPTLKVTRTYSNKRKAAKQGSLSTVENNISPEQDDIAEQKYIISSEQDNMAEQEYFISPEQDNVEEQKHIISPEQDDIAEQKYNISLEQENITEQNYITSGEQDNHAEQKYNISVEQENITEQKYIISPEQDNIAEVKNISPEQDTILGKASYISESDVTNEGNVSKSYSCDRCSKTYKTESGLKRHQELHLVQDKTLSKDTILENNGIDVVKEIKLEIDNEQSSEFDAPNDGKFYSCGQCKKICKTESGFKRHQKSHIKRANRKFVCKICQKVYKHTQRRSYNEHVRSHEGMRKFLCTECGMSHQNPYTLRQHLLRHQGHRNMVCPECPKTFVTKTDVRAHYLKVHKANRSNYACEICERTYSSSGALAVHKKSHDNDKLIACTVCSKRFTSNFKLERHMLVHTGEKPYKCKFCDAAYTQYGILITHLRRHLGNLVYQCSLCPQRFATTQDGKEHFETHKNDDDETRAKNLAEFNALEIKGVFCRNTVENSALFRKTDQGCNQNYVTFLQNHFQTTAKVGESGESLI